LRIELFIKNLQGTQAGRNVGIISLRSMTFGSLFNILSKFADDCGSAAQESNLWKTLPESIKKEPPIP
jgi:hypothetical protein